MLPREKLYILKIINYKKTIFINLLNSVGILISSKSFKVKETKDKKVKFTSGLMAVLKIIKDLKKPIKYISIFVSNLHIKMIQTIFFFFKTWNIKINYIKYKLPLPHNGCRRKHDPRKRRKGLKKQKKLILSTK